jgi:endonuclease/exonuclease/phosphatase family metal-dependent hydrolase
VSHGPWYPWWAEYEREHQAVAAAQVIEEKVAHRPQHVVIAGDFNATPDTASIRFWSGRQSLHGMSVCYQDVWERLHPDDPGHTFSPRNALAFHDEPFLKQGRRIDHILIRCGNHGPTLDVAACTLAFNKPVNGVWASDHFGVVADLVVPA